MGCSEGWCVPSHPKAAQFPRQDSYKGDGKTVPIYHCGRRPGRAGTGRRRRTRPHARRRVPAKPLADGSQFVYIAWVSGESASRMVGALGLHAGQGCSGSSGGTTA